MGKDISSRGNSKCKDLKVLEMLRGPGNMGVGGEVCQASLWVLVLHPQTGKFTQGCEPTM